MSKPPPSPNNDLVEALAKIEHEQWMHWSKTVASQVSPMTRKRWESSWMEYDQLADEVKEADRVWARKVVNLLREHKLIE